MKFGVPPKTRVHRVRRVAFQKRGRRQIPDDRAIVRLDQRICAIGNKTTAGPLLERTATSTDKMSLSPCHAALTISTSSQSSVHNLLADLVLHCSLVSVSRSSHYHDYNYPSHSHSLHFSRVSPRVAASLDFPHCSTSNSIPERLPLALLIAWVQCRCCFLPAFLLWHFRPTAEMLEFFDAFHYGITSGVRLPFVFGLFSFYVPFASRSGRIEW